MKRIILLAMLAAMTGCYGGFDATAPETRATGALAQSYRSGTFTIETQWDSALVVTPQVKRLGDAAINWWVDVLAENALPSLAGVPEWRFRQCGVEPPSDRTADMVIRVEASARTQRPAAVVPCRRTEGLPFTGVIWLPQRTFTDSLAHEPSAGFVDFALRHEMAHVLGIGYWYGVAVVGVNGSSVVGGGRYFAGDSATAVYRRLTGNVAPYGVPLDYNQVEGRDWHYRTEYSDHWRFGALPDEAMIPYYLPDKSQAMSAVTLAALADLGWQVDMSMAEPLPTVIR